MDVINTTLCYIEKDGCFLLQYRNKKPNDINEGKWIGVGGKFEPGETAEQCLLREVYEETRIRLRDYTFLGIIEFRPDDWPAEDMYLYKAKVSDADCPEGLTNPDFCREGRLEWIEAEKIPSLRMWEGDPYFLKPLLEGRTEINLRLEYYGDKLVKVTERTGKMTIENAIEQLMQLQAKMSAYNHAMGVIYYDGVTTAPKNTAANRGHSLSILSEEAYKLSTCKETEELLNYLDENKAQLDEKQARMVEVLIKDQKNMAKIPMDEYVAYQKLLNDAEDVWHRAKENSDFELFRPYLEQIFDTHKRFAGYIAPEKDPYDYWLGEYEDGVDRAYCDDFFGKVRSRLVPLLKAISEKPQVDDSWLTGSFPIDRQDQLSHYLMKLQGLDEGHVGLSTTEHPFTTSLGSHHDVRITTHYSESNFVSSMYSIIHEGGHALYDSGCADDLAYTALDGGVSMGIHESQSRFYENIIGRSRAYCTHVWPKLCELFPQLAEHTAEDFYKAVNKAQPSLIRTEADETTYCLHIMVRYELEKRVMAGELEVKDLPAEWNRLYKEYLGVDVPNDAQGLLQDVHWAGGMIGYFPSYALGSAYGVQFLAKAKESIDVEKCVLEGNLEPLNAWNKEHIWKHGCLYKPGQLLQRVLGGKFDPEPYICYLEEKCRDIYGL